MNEIEKQRAELTALVQRHDGPVIEMLLTLAKHFELPAEQQAKRSAFTRHVERCVMMLNGSVRMLVCYMVFGIVVRRCEYERSERGVWSANGWFMNRANSGQLESMYDQYSSVVETQLDREEQLCW